MAIKGDVGKIMFENTGGTEAAVGQTRSWSLSITKDTMETTKQADTSKTFIGGLISGEGSAELLYNPDETGTGYTTGLDFTDISGEKLYDYNYLSKYAETNIVFWTNNYLFEQINMFLNKY